MQTLTIEHVLSAIDKLQKIFPCDIERGAPHVWLNILEDLHPSQLDHAVKVYLSGDKTKMPTPGMILNLAPTTRYENSPDEDPEWTLRYHAQQNRMGLFQCIFENSVYAWKRREDMRIAGTYEIMGREFEYGRPKEF